MISEQVTSRTRAIHAEFSEVSASAPYLLCDRYPGENVAFRFVDRDLDSTEMTFHELAARSRRVAKALSDRGVGPGDRVATILGKGEDLPAIILGIWRLGAVYVPLFTAFAAGAVADRVHRAEAKIVITDAQQLPKVEPSGREILLANSDQMPRPEMGDYFDLGAWIRAGELWDGQTPTGPDVPMTLMFTSGTTGAPKIVLHTLDYLAGWKAYLEFGFGVTSEDVFWDVADPGWAYGLYGGIAGPLSLGITSLVTTYPFDPAATLAVLERYEVTNFAAAPTVYRAMRAAAPTPAAIPSLRALSSAGEPLTSEVNEWTETHFGQKVHDHYGQTELGMTIGFAHHAQVAVPISDGAMGLALPGWSMTVLAQESTTPVGPGELGRLAVDVHASDYMTFTGYGIDRDIPGSRFTSDGAYYLTGDIASIDGDGIIRFSARDDDVILMAGYRIGPSDVESVLITHPEVVECAVVAGPDEVRGEVIHAFVVARASGLGEASLTRQLQEHVRTNYAAHAYPRRITYVDSLPKTESGKIRRAALRASLTRQEKLGG